MAFHISSPSDSWLNLLTMLNYYWAKKRGNYGLRSSAFILSEPEILYAIFLMSTMAEIYNKTSMACYFKTSFEPRKAELVPTNSKIIL